MPPPSRFYALGAALLGLLFTVGTESRAQQNDAFAGRLPIDAASAVVVGDVSAATREAEEPAHVGTAGLRSVWWRWTPAADHQAQVSLVGADEEAVALAVYTGSTLGRLVTIASAHNSSDGTAPAALSFAARAGVEYAICASLPLDLPARRVVLALNQAPLFSIAAEHRLAVGSSVSLPVPALHAPVDYSVDGLPPGLAFDPAGARITGTPLAPGEHWLDLSAENAFGQGTARLRLDIRTPAVDAPLAPHSAPPRSIHGLVGKSLSAYVSPSASDGRTTFSASGLPPGLNLHPGTGEISGAASSAGIFEATVTAANAAGSFASPVTFVIAAGADAPVLRGAAAVELVLGESLSLALDPSDTAATLSASSLPDGVSLDTASRRLVGTPSTAGLHHAEVTATNAAGSSTARFAVLVHPAPVRPPEFTHNGIWVTELGIGSTFRLGAAQGPVTFAVEDLPAWASFDAATSTLSARPASLGIFPIRVAATNARGTTRGIVNLYVGTVTPPLIPSFLPGVPELNAPLSIPGTVGAAFSHYVPATNSGRPYISSPLSPAPALTVDGLPPGLNFNPQNRTITGTVNSAGDYPITIRYFENGDMIEAVATLAFRPPAPASPTAPAADPASLISAPLTLSARAGASTSLAVFTPAADASFTVSGLPPGLSFNAGTGRISGTPTTTSAFPLDLAVSNAAGQAAARSLLQVAAALRPRFFSSPVALGATSGVGFSEWFYASNSPTSYSCLGPLPPGLSFDGAEGTLEGTPTTPGTYSLGIRATNSAGSDEVYFTLVVRPPEPAEIRFPAQLILTQGVGTIKSAGSWPTGATYVAAGLPPGLAFSSSGTLSGAPTTPGDYEVTIHASRNGQSSSLRSSFRVLPAVAPSEIPVFNSAAGTSAVLGAPFSFRLSATHYPTAYTADPLPPGLALDPATGLLSGTPAQAGDFLLACTASNAHGSTTSRLALRVLAAPIAPPTFSLPASAVLTLGDANASLDLQPGNSPASLTATGLPRGLEMNSAGLIRGVPRMPGVFPVSVHAANAAGSTTAQFDLEVRTSRYAPLPTLNTILRARVGRAFNQAVTYSLPGGEQPFEIEVLGLPPGLSFDPATKSIAGTPEESGASELEILVRTVAYGGYARVRLIVAEAAPERPSFTSPSTVLATLNQPFTHQLEATGSVTSFGATSLPSWLTLNSATGLLSGTPTSRGDISFLVSATNAQGTRVARLNIAARPAGETPPLLLDTPGSLVARIGERFYHEFSFAHSGGLNYISNFYGNVGYGPPPFMEYTPPPYESAGVRTITVYSYGPGGSHASLVAFEIENPDAGVPNLYAPAAIRAHSSSYVSQSFSTSLPSATFSASGLPPGLSLSPWGHLSGSPSRFGEFIATITASSGGQQISGTVLVSAINLASPPTSSPAAPAAALEYSVGNYVSFAPALPDTSSFYSSDLIRLAEGLPPGLVFDPSRGRILGTPDTPGTYTVKISVVPAPSSYYSGYPPLPEPTRTVIVVRPAPIIPSHFTSPAEYRATLGIDFTATLAATHGPALFTASGLPPGLALDAHTGAITGRPTAAGEFLVSAAAANTAGSVPAGLRFVISPDTPRPVIGGHLHAVLRAGESTSRSLGLLNAPASVSATGLPPGMSLSAAGTLTGTPTTPGDYPVLVSATNGGGTSTANILCQVLPADLPDLFWPAIDLSFEAGETVNELILWQVPAAGTYEFEALDLPPGLHLDRSSSSSIYLEGRLDTPGLYPVTFTLSAHGQSLAVPGLVRVLAPAAPALSSAAARVVTAGTAFDYSLIGSPFPLHWSLSSLPEGLVFNAASRRLSGVLASPGTHEIPITATSPSGETSSRLTLFVRPPAPPAPDTARPFLNSSAYLLAHVGAPVFHPLASANSEASFGVGALPAGLRYDPTRRAILGHPLAPGRHLVAVSAHAGGMSESATLLITVRPYETRLANLLPDPRLPAGGVGYVGIPYQDASATLRTAPDAWSFAGLPPGLLGLSTGLVTGAPTAAGEFDFTASLGSAPPLTFARALTIESAPRSIALPVHAAQVELLQKTRVAVPVSVSQPATLTFSGLLPKLVYSAEKREIYGVPFTAPGTYPVEVTATNAHGSFTSRLYLVMRPMPGAPRFTSASAASATRHENFSYAAATLPAASSFTAVGLPAGISLDPATGRISGRPEQAGEHTIELTATNAAGSDTLALRLRVASGLAAEPALAVRANSLWPLGTDRSLLLAHPGTTAITAASLPSGVALDATARLLFGRAFSTGAETLSLSSSVGAARPRLVSPEPSLSPPWFLQEPEDLVALAGRPARFLALVEGRSAPTVSWSLDGVARPAEADGSLLLASADPALDGAPVFARAVNPSGQISSRIATLTVRSTPVLSFAEWTASRGLPPDRRGPLDSPASGATPNLLAYAMDLADGEDFLPAPEFIALPVPVLRLTYSRAKFADGVVLTPQHSTDLSAWREDGITTEKLSEDAYREIWRATVPTSGPRRFLRLAATVTPTP